MKHLTLFLLILIVQLGWLNMLQAQSNTIVGASAGSSLTNGSENSLYGFEAGNSITSGRFNSFFGHQSGKKTTSSSNSFFGKSSGINNTSGAQNAFFGMESGGFNTIASNNAFFGFRSGLRNVNGSGNTFYGAFSGEENNSGSLNTFIGQAAGQDSKGSNNTFIGANAGPDHNTGSSNTYIGTTSGLNIEEGSNNIFIGYRTGFCSGDHTVSNQLWINNQCSTTPLIYGEFDNKFVKINGTFEVTAGLSNPSDVHLKNNFETIDASEILEKIQQLNIQKWTYKERQNETHIGATAQDFYKAFGLGTDDKHISTIDADGVALAAIKALKKENDTQAKLIQELIERIEKLEN